MSANILIVGTGAIGSFYGSLLAKSGQQVSVVARSDYEVVKQQGIQIQSVLGDWIFKPKHVVKTAQDYPEQADYVVLCTKVTDEIDRAALIKDALHPETSIVLIQNGIAIEEEIALAFPQHTLISGLAFICATRLQPGLVSHTAYGRLSVGRYPQGVCAKTHAFAQLFENSGIRCATTETVQTARWQKTVWNAPFNPISVLSGGLDTQRVLSTQEPYIRALMAEVIAIAEASGHSLPADIVDLNVDSTYKMPAYKTSMLIDFESGRGMETEAILGNAVRVAEKLDVEIPYLKSLYALMKLREAALLSH